jgi:chemotaxis protein MotB
MQDEVRFELDERGLVVTVVTDDVLFALGSATLRPAGNAVLDAIAPALKALPNQVTVEGHTDDLPLKGRGSNWELSTERATSVLRYMLDRHAVPAGRLSAAGYADQRPLTPNISPAARSANRRVEVIVRATPHDELPTAAPKAAPIGAAIPPITAVPDPVPAIRSTAPASTGTTHAPGTHATTDEEH